jgi:hypothetical protein
MLNFSILKFHIVSNESQHEIKDNWYIKNFAKLIGKGRKGMNDSNQE